PIGRRWVVAGCGWTRGSARAALCRVAGISASPRWWLRGHRHAGAPRVGDGWGGGPDRLGHLGRGVEQGGTDLVDLHLDHGALLALAGLEAALLELALHDDPGAAGEALRDALGLVAPHRAGQERRLAV